jgi:aspartate/methionine/tyrosine aminotransferase
MWLEMLGIKAKLMPFKPDQNGIPNPLDAERLVTKKTKAIVLISPNNPTGAIYPPDIITSFYELARDKKIALIIDETYKDFLGSIQPHYLFQKKQWEETFIQIYSFSKVFSLTGYRVGSIIAGDKTIKSITKIMDTLAICAPRISQGRRIIWSRQFIQLGI